MLLNGMGVNSLEGQMAKKKVLGVDSTSQRMNDIAQDLLETRNKACDEIIAYGWPADIYSDPEWYVPLGSLPYKRQKNFTKADMIRNSILEIDFTLAAMNHYSETYIETTPSDEVDAVIEALESAINAITAFFSPNAETGKRQRDRARKSRPNPKRDRKYQKWKNEDERLKVENPHLSEAERARHISVSHNKDLQSGEKAATKESVRGVLRKLHQKVGS